MTTDSNSSNTNISGDVQANLKRLGKYDIVRKIGAGGMGTVYLAQDKHLNRTVALKVLPKDRAENPILVRRFQSEARASAMLTHDNIVAVYDADEADGYLYIALEYIDGIDLFEWLKKRERIPVKRSIDIVKQVAAALQHAHEKNLVHRDIKPANIMITKEGLVKLADMGLARSIDESLDTTITRDGTTVGTVDYMSPEQAAHSKNTDIRSDIYSLGCTWYHMLAGEPPFASGSMTNKLAAHAKDPPPDPREFNENVTEAIVAIIHRMLAKKKEDRYQTPAELLDDLNNSTNLESNSDNLLAMLLADELEDDLPEESEEFDRSEYILVDEDEEIDEDSVDFIVQEERQSALLKKHNERKRASAETNPDMPTRHRKKQHKKKRSLPPKVERSDSPETVPDTKEETPKERKRLKRVQSKEELEESGTENSSANQTKRKETKPTKKQEVLQKQNLKSKKQKKPKPAVPKSASSKKAKKTPQQSPRTKSTREKPLPPQKDPGGGGINVDWGRAGIAILVAGLALAGIWWGASRFGGEALKRELNPYGEGKETTSESGPENSENTSIPGKKQSHSDEERPQVVDAVVQPVVEPDDEKIQTPQWIIAGWDTPKNEERKTLTVQRGAERANSFHTLEAALDKVNSNTGTIDLSQLTHSRLSRAQLKLTEKLRIVGNNTKPVLAFRSDVNKSTSSPWLSVRGGTLVLEGLNFIVTNDHEDPLEFLRLEGADLIIRNCTFTSIGRRPVEFIGVHQKSKLSNRILVENSLFRGQNVSGICIHEVPCDLFCEDTLISSQENHLVRVERSQNSTEQKVHFKNCTFVGGAASLAIKSQQDSQSGSEVLLAINRSLFIGGKERATTAILLRIPEDSTEEEKERPQHVSLKQQHTRFINIKELTKVESEKSEAISVSKSEEWDNFWSNILPSGDILSDQDLGDAVFHPETLSAESLDAKVRKIARPGVGERALIGADVDQVAELNREEVLREIAMNRIDEVQSSIYPVEWSEESVRFDLKGGANLNTFLASDKCPDGTTVVCFGAGLRKISPVTLKNRKLKLQFEQSEGVPLKVTSANDAATTTLFKVESGLLTIQDGPFRISKSRAEKDGTTFLHASEGARVQLEQVHVSAPMEAEGKNQLITIIPTQSDQEQNVIEITNSMLNGPGSLVRFNAASQSLIVKNSILVSSHNILTVKGSSQNGVILLEGSTFSANAAVVECLNAQTPIETLARESVFATPVNRSSQSSILNGNSHEIVKQTLNWWETACAYSGQISAPVKIADQPLPGSFESAWQRFWGASHIYDPLTGPQAVVLTKELSTIEDFSPHDLQLQQTGQLANWSTNGRPIGAKVNNVGPQFGPKKSAATKQPVKVNTPSGF